jgi:hypothetical protein
MSHVHDIERLIPEVEALADPPTRDRVRNLVQAILAYHEDAISRICELAGDAAVRSFARDELAASLLLLYGLHPDDFETRVRRALDRVPGAELAGISEFAVRVKGTAPREAVEAALYGAAPEVSAIEMETAAAAFVPVEALLGR